ncbi:PAAR-like domain-containing protein, partial [Rhizobium helianthi]
QDSKFSCCYGDEPGVGKGVKSGTVGDVVEPVTSSTIVRANGIPI